MDIDKLKQELNNIEFICQDIAYLIEVTRDSCQNNEFFAQELTLNLALEHSEKIMDTIERMSNILYNY